MQQKISDEQRNEPELCSLEQQSAEEQEEKLQNQHDLNPPFNKFSQQMACS
jgi:hypothetical protein